MPRIKKIVVVAALFALAMIMTGCGSDGQISDIEVTEPEPATPISQGSIQLAGYKAMNISQPHTFKNLTLFFLSTPHQTIGQDFLLLDEAMEKKLVKVTEKEQAEVRNLLIENMSDKPVFIQVGDIVKGGKQTRTIQASLVIPPRSGKIELPSLCVEQSRWHGQSSFDFCADGNVGLSGGKKMRLAVQKAKQGEVWKSVKVLKESARVHLAMPHGSETSSVTEELDNEKMHQATGEFEKALANLLDKYPNAVGIAYAVNGEISTVELYQSHSLLKKMYTRLVKSFAVEAITHPAKEKEPKKITAEDLKNFVARSLDGQKKEEQFKDNTITRIENDKAFSSQDQYKSQIIHTQIIKK